MELHKLSFRDTRTDRPTRTSFRDTRTDLDRPTAVHVGYTKFFLPRDRPNPAFNAARSIASELTGRCWSVGHVVVAFYTVEHSSISVQLQV